MRSSFVRVLSATLLGVTLACSASPGTDPGDDDENGGAAMGGAGGTAPDGSTEPPISSADGAEPATMDDAQAPGRDVLPQSTQPSRSVGCGKIATGSGTYERNTLTVAGASRTYFVWVPKNYDPEQAYPVLFHFHGTGGTAPGNGRGVELSAAGTEAILISPQGLQGVWALGAEGDDVQFFDAMYDSIRNSHCVNQQRVFAMGFSRGGAMSNLLGCVRGHQVRGIGPLAAWQPAPASACVGNPSAWFAHGEGDRVVAVTQGTRARDFIRQRHQCDSEARPTMPSPCVEYENCRDGVKLVWCAIEGDHGAVIEYAAPRVWDFFKTL